MFTVVFAANDALKGKYYGYDGPCPPWNDENVHHMHFNVYALSVKTLGLPADFDGPAAMDAMKGKVLAEGKLDTIYTTIRLRARSFPSSNLLRRDPPGAMPGGFFSLSRKNNSRPLISHHRS